MKLIASVLYHLQLGIQIGLVLSATLTENLSNTFLTAVCKIKNFYLQLT